MADPNLRCYICGCVAEGKLFPNCCKCSMLVCRQHRDKNGFFTQTYSCFPVCRPPAMRIPWAERVALQLKVENDRRRAAELQDATQNGTGCDAFAMHDKDDDDALLPKRLVSATAAVSASHGASIVRAEDLAGKSNPKSRSAASRSDMQSRGLPTDEIAQWRQSLAPPTPSSSPGAMKETAKPQATMSSGAPAPTTTKVTLSKCSEAHSTRIEEWMDDDQAVRPDDSEDEDLHLPVKGKPLSSSTGAVPAPVASHHLEDFHYLPIRYRGGDPAMVHHLSQGGEVVAPRDFAAHDAFDEDDFVDVVTNHSVQRRREFAFARA